MATKTFKIGLSNTDKQNMAQDVYERVLALTFAEYDSANTYNKGDFVVYDDTLYQCKQDNTTGTWDSSKWQQATLQDLLDDIEGAVAFVNDKANVDGNYPTMTVGAADNLTPYDEDSGTDQEQPFLLQGTGCGNGEQQVDTGALALLKEKQGNTVVVNQKLITTAGSFENNDITFVKSFDANGNLKVTANGTATGLAYANLGNERHDLKDHKILLRGCPAGGDSDTYYIKDGYGYQLDTGNGVIITAGDDFVLQIIINEGVTVTDLVFEPIVVDLTQWFGSNDNIPAHLLSHPEDFFRYYQGSLAYNEGTLVNADGRYLKTIGRNQWDEEVKLNTNINQNTGEEFSYEGSYVSKNYIRVIPNATYYFKCPRTLYLRYYDKDKNYVGYGAINNDYLTIPSNVCYMRFIDDADAYGNDITISIYYEGESGYDKYYPYEELANIDTGTEVLRSAGNVKDSKLPDGTITRRVGTYTFTGSESWVLRGSDTNCDYYYLYLNVSPATENQFVNGNLICNKAFAGNSWSGNEPYLIGIDVNTLYASVPTGTNPQTIFTSGTVLFYELATPTTEQGTTFSENLVIDDFGSMEFGGTNGVPQGASIFYAVDYKAFIDSLYNTLDGDATDIVKDSELDSKLATLGYVKLTSVSGYDATKTQVLKNVEGTLTWVTEE